MAVAEPQGPVMTFGEMLEYNQIDLVRKSIGILGQTVFRHDEVKVVETVPGIYSYIVEGTHINVHGSYLWGTVNVTFDTRKRVIWIEYSIAQTEPWHSCKSDIPTTLFNGHIVISEYLDLTFSGFYNLIHN